MTRLRNNQGISLIEVLVVIFTFGIIASIALPNILAYLPNLQLRQASRDFFIDMQEAKSLAIKSNAPTGVTITTVACPGLPNSIPSPGGTYTLFTDDGSGGVTSGDGLQTGTEQTIRTINLPSRVALCNGAIQLGATSFLPSGSSIAPGTVTFTNTQNNTSSVTMTISGNIRQN